MEVSLSLLAYDTQTNDNYSLDDSHCEKKKKKQKPCLVISKTKWVENQMRNEALLPLINYIITHISLYFTPLPLKKKTCNTNLLISKKLMRLKKNKIYI